MTIIRFAYKNSRMKTSNNLNTFALLKWIVDNGELEAKQYLSQHVGISIASINRLLAGGTTPRREHRYKIYSVTGIILRKEDNFPETEIKNIA